MLRYGTEIRYRLTDILASHWDEFFTKYQYWIRPEIIETVRKILACRTPILGCHVYMCPQCGETRLVPHSCKCRFCPTCGKNATDVWADWILDQLILYFNLLAFPRRKSLIDTLIHTVHSFVTLIGLTLFF